MPNASRVIIDVVDNSFQAVGALVGISGFIGTFERGPINDPDILITSPQQLRRLYGGPVSGSDDYLLAERVLNRGGQLRIVNIRHYTDATNPQTLTALKADNFEVTMVDPVTPADPAVPLFELAPKYEGAKYNSLKVEISAPSNGQTALGFFNLTIFIEGDEFYTTEVYENLQTQGRVDIANSNFLRDVESNSNLVTPVYIDQTAAGGAGAFVPTIGVLTTSGGSNGGPVVPTDIIGSVSAGTGMYALDSYSDMYDFAAPSITDAAVHIAGANYATARGDIEYLAHLNHTLTNPAALIAARGAITVNSRYYSVFSGGIKVLDPQTSSHRVISEVADVMGIGAYVDTNFKPWFNQDNYVRGSIPNAIGVNYNLGSPGNFRDLNQLANRQINMVVADKGLVYLKGNFTGQLGNSKGSFRNVTRLLIYIKKTLRPVLEKYLGEPTDFPTFRAIYNDVKPFLQSLKDGRATYSIPSWQGDQDANKVSDLKVNTPSDLDMGKYRIRLVINPIVGINEIVLTIGMSSTGIDFEDPNNI